MGVLLGKGEIHSHTHKTTHGTTAAYIIQGKRQKVEVVVLGCLEALLNRVEPICSSFSSVYDCVDHRDNVTRYSYWESDSAWLLSFVSVEDQNEDGHVDDATRGSDGGVAIDPPDLRNPQG